MSDNIAPSVYSKNHVKARKQHTCCECNRVILPGERYQLFKGCWDGEWDNYKTCGPCARLRDEIGSTVLRDEYPAFGYLAEYATEAGYNFIVFDRNG